MGKIKVHPSKFESFGDSRDSVFCLVTDPVHRDLFEIEADAKYSRSIIVEYAGDTDFVDYLTGAIPENAHVLVILPTHYFKSPPPDTLGPTRKLGVLACFSTPSSAASIEHFLRMAERTDPVKQQRMADEFFARGEAAERLRFVDPEHGTAAEFEHLGDELSWHEQIGRLGWGEQQLFPSGEVSVLPVEVFGQNIEASFKISGALALRGHPVLHSGTPSFLPEDRDRIYQKLVTLRDHAVIARLEEGRIVDITPTHPSCAPAADMLRAMCDVDSRYGSLLEIGFGINTGLELFPGNSAMNEVYGGSRGAVHFGLGLIPYTQYHLDLICPGTKVLDEQNRLVFGG